MKHQKIIVALFISIVLSISTSLAFFLTNDTYNNNFHSEKYNIKINGNGGVFGNEVVTIKNNKTILPSPTKEGYNFLGYSTTANGVVLYSTSIENIDSINNTEIYAIWELAGSLITLDTDGGTGGSTTIRVSSGETMPSITLPTKTGYTFNGYYTGTNGTGTQYYSSSGGSARNWDINDSSYTLYAYWIPKTTTITLNKSNGSGGSVNVIAKYGSTIPTVSIPSRTGFTFGGYYTGTNGTGTQYINSSGVGNRTWNFEDSTKTLYARWIVKSTSITLDKQNGSRGTSSVSALYGSSMPSISLPSRTGYTFNGYYTSTSGSGTQYYNSSGGSARNWDKENSSYTLYAYWGAVSYDITYNLDGGSASNPSTYTIEDSITLSNPTKTGHSFSGWTGSNGSTPSTNVSFSGETGNKSYTANWSVNSYTISFDANGGSGGSSITRNYGSTLGSLPSTSRKGYSFDGWYTSKSGGSKISTSTTVTGSTTYYAHWTDIGVSGVTSGSFSTSPKANSSRQYATFSWSKTGTSGNCTTISWELVGVCTSTSSTKCWSTTYVQVNKRSVTIDCSNAYSSSSNITMYNGTKLASGSENICHDSNGNKSFSASVSIKFYGLSSNSTGSGSWTLPTIY